MQLTKTVIQGVSQIFSIYFLTELLVQKRSVSKIYKVLKLFQDSSNLHDYCHYFEIPY